MTRGRRWSPFAGSLVPWFRIILPCRCRARCRPGENILAVTTSEALRTWTDDSVWRSGPVSLRALRSMRAKPPGAAVTNRGRADVFRSALEQAEQQWAAARTVGYESRPLNLFYGLSQAGRAIAAAAAGLPDTHPAALQPAKDAVRPWELQHHGIEVEHIASVTDTSFPTMRMTRKGKPHSSGSFARLAALLSPRCDVGAGATMSQLWASIPEAVKDAPLTDTVAAPVLTVQVVEGPDGPASDATLARGFLYSGAPIDGFGATVTDEQVLAFMGQYPRLAGARVRECYEQNLGPAWDPGRPSTLAWVCLPVPAEHPWLIQPHQHRWITRPLTTDYRGRHLVLPGIGTNDPEPLHPLLTWWAILFGLSMLCRYRPTVWTDLINIDGSDYASAIEHMLNVALDAVPDLVERTSGRWPTDIGRPPGITGRKGSAPAIYDARSCVASSGSGRPGSRPRATE